MENILMTHMVYAANTAPQAARATLTTIEKGFGFIPNMLGAMAGAPAVLEAYQTGGALFDKTSFNATERQIVMLTTSAENRCEYCMGAHSALSATQKVDAQAVDAKLDFLGKAPGMAGFDADPEG
jgi:AhpD family alkylhydroperoxidase